MASSSPPHQVKRRAEVSPFERVTFIVTGPVSNAYYTRLHKLPAVQCLKEILDGKGSSAFEIAVVLDSKWGVTRANSVPVFGPALATADYTLVPILSVRKFLRERKKHVLDTVIEIPCMVSMAEDELAHMVSNESLAKSRWQLYVPRVHFHPSNDAVFGLISIYWWLFLLDAVTARFQNWLYRWMTLFQMAPTSPPNVPCIVRASVGCYDLDKKMGESKKIPTPKFEGLTLPQWLQKSTITLSPVNEVPIFQAFQQSAMGFGGLVRGWLMLVGIFVHFTYILVHIIRGTIFEYIAYHTIYVAMLCVYLICISQAWSRWVGPMEQWTMFTLLFAPLTATAFAMAYVLAMLWNAVSWTFAFVKYVCCCCCLSRRDAAFRDQD